jgi:hypothetical protein
VESEKNQGSLFTVFLPAVVSTADKRTREKGGKSPTPPREE